MKTSRGDYPLWLIVLSWTYEYAVRAINWLFSDRIYVGILVVAAIFFAGWMAATRLS